MPHGQKRNNQALTVDLQNYTRQGISIWLGDDRPYSGQTADAINVREDISYMEKSTGTSQAPARSGT